MTSRQIKKALEAADIPLDYIKISNREVEIFIPSEFDSEVADFDATEDLMDRVQKVLHWGGHRCGYGAWVLREGYVVDERDFCDKASCIHY
jgi:hypothetical protein